MKSTRSGKAAAAAKDGKPKRGVVSRTLGYVKSHPKASATAAAAGVLAAGVGAYAWMRRGKKGKKSAGTGRSARRGGAGRKSSGN